MQNALRASQSFKKHFKTGLHTDTGYPVQINYNLYLALTVLNKTGNYFVTVCPNKHGNSLTILN